jgi:hypothetical protein
MNKEKYHYMGIAFEKVKHKELYEAVLNYAKETERPVASAVRILLEKGLQSSSDR